MRFPQLMAVACIRNFERGFFRENETELNCVGLGPLQFSIFGAAVSQENSGGLQMECNIQENRFSQPRSIPCRVQKKKGLFPGI
jgi:hypothetical protein